MVQHSQIRRTTQCQPAPSRPGVSSKGAEKPAGEHDILRRDANEQVRTGQAGDQGEVCEEEGGG